MYTTGTQIQYLHLCHRKLWLFAHGINMEHTSALVAEGKLIDENSYPQRASKWQELAIEGIKIDHYDAQHNIVREVKKSNKREGAHIAQLKFYLFVLERNGIEVSHGVIEYPKLRLTEEVWLTEEDRVMVPQWEEQVQAIIARADCPDRIEDRLCRKCAYFDFCYAE
ncbi:MAG: CRISPR-associated protein Cas4 [Bacteroidota bacterium]